MTLVNHFLASIPVIEQRNVDTIGRRKSRGKSAELELVHLLEKYGYGARRSAASGVGGWVSDVEATKEGIWLAIEVKSSRRGYAIIPHHQLEKIRQDLAFAGKSGIPTLGICAAKFPHCEPPWCFYKLSPEDYSKEFIKIRRGQGSNWTPVQSEQQLTSEDPFSLEPSKSYFPARMGRPVSNIPKVKCPRCGETAHRPTAYKKKSRGKIYTYWRYWHKKGVSCTSRVKVEPTC